ncbi:hypothetical protein D3C81_2025800 [compost metagenome]
MAIVALANVVLSRSDIVRPLSIATGVEVVRSPDLKLVEPPLVVTTGVWFVAVTVTVRVTVLLVLPAPSITLKLIVRVAVFGVTAVFV